MRERTTWSKKEVLKKASQKRAEVNNDVYTLNQERTQPAFDKYEIGGPEDFMEGVDDSNRWEADQKRDEIGRGEFIKDVPKGLEKGAASHDFLLKKADLCVEVARMMLANTRVASETAIEDQAVALMHLPDLDLISTHSRLAAQEEEQDQDEDEGQEKQTQDDEDDSSEEQSKEAGEIPPQLKEHVEKMQEKAEDKKDDSKKASQQMYGQMEQMMAQMQQMMAKLQQQGQQQGLDQDQVQDIVEDKVEEQVEDALQDAGLDDLQDQGLDQLGEQDIQMDPFEMDLDDSQGLDQDDDLLRQVFAGDDEEEKEEAPAQQAKQAAVRTASTRTIGTKPKGVSKLGGVSKQASVSSSGPDLSALWTSLPDVSDAFGMKK